MPNEAFRTAQKYDILTICAIPIFRHAFATGCFFSKQNGFSAVKPTWICQTHPFHYEYLSNSFFRFADACQNG
jgi:hypothetical protein